MNDVMTIEGSAATCGRLRGALQARILADRVREMHRRAAAVETPLNALHQRADAFAERIRRVAPEWLEETRALAEAAGLDARDILALNCLPPDFYDATVNECTAFLAVGRTTNQLLKIRDTRNTVQCFFAQAMRGLLPVQLGAAVGGLGAGHAVNAEGLAGACNTGSHTALVDDAPRFDDCHVLRFLLERASRVEEIPELYATLVGQEVAGGAGPGRGALYLFVDRRRGLLLEAAGTEFETTWFDEGVHVVSNHFLSSRAQGWWSRGPELNTSRRRERMQQLARSIDPDRPDPMTVFAMTRDRKHHPHALCNDDAKHFWMTVSAQWQVIDRGGPSRSVNWICCGNTAQSLFIPVPLAESRCFVPLADGRFYQRANARYQRFGCGRQLRSQQRHFEKLACSRGAAAWLEICADAFERVDLA